MEQPPVDTQKEKRHQYYLDNKEHIIVINRQSASRHYDRNRDTILEKQRNNVSVRRCECCEKDVKGKSWVMHQRTAGHIAKSTPSPS